MRRRGRAGLGVLAVVAAGLGLGLRPAMAEEAVMDEEVAAAPLSCTGTIPRYSLCEIALSATGAYANPFTGVNVTASFTPTPAGPALTAYGFHDGGQTWRVRFAPKTAATSWTYTVSNTVGDAGLTRTGSFTVGSPVSGAKGFIEVDPAHPYYFRFSNGDPFYGIGDTAYGLVNGISDTPHSDPQKNLQRQRYLDDRQTKKFNFIRFFVPGVPKNINEFVTTAEGWPWGGQPGTPSRPGTPDYTRINLQFFRRLERILGELKTRGMYAELIVFNYYPSAPMRTTAWTTAHQDLWAKYVVSRLSAYDRVFLWTVTNEYDIYPGGVYETFTSADNTWAKDMAGKFHTFDPHKHPTTVHPWENPQMRLNPMLDLGPRFGSSTAVDVLTQQHWGRYKWNTTKGCNDWNVGPTDVNKGSIDDVDVAIRRDRKSYTIPTGSRSMPVINTENDYERLPGTYPQPAETFSCTETARRSAWRIFLAGGATYAAGFAGTFLGQDPFTFKNVPSYFTLSTGGMGQQVAHYAAFINQTDYRTMNPAESLVTPAAALCLAKPGSEYVVYAPTGGNVQLDLRTQPSTTSFAVTRLDPRTGATTALSAITGGGWRSLPAPTGNDYVFRVKRQ